MLQKLLNLRSAAGDLKVACVLKWFHLCLWRNACEERPVPSERSVQTPSALLSPVWYWPNCRSIFISATGKIWDKLEDNSNIFVGEVFVMNEMENGSVAACRLLACIRLWMEILGGCYRWMIQKLEYCQYCANNRSTVYQSSIWIWKLFKIRVKYMLYFMC